MYFYFAYKFSKKSGEILFEDSAQTIAISTVGKFSNKVSNCIETYKDKPLKDLSLLDIDSSDSEPLDNLDVDWMGRDRMNVSFADLEQFVLVGEVVTKALTCVTLVVLITF